MWDIVLKPKVWTIILSKSSGKYQSIVSIITLFLKTIKTHKPTKSEGSATVRSWYIVWKPMFWTITQNKSLICENYNNQWSMNISWGLHASTKNIHLWSLEVWMVPEITAWTDASKDVCRSSLYPHPTEVCGDDIENIVWAGVANENFTHELW